jgi:serine phosphatase RsbU (regulator of sigma subunit)
MSATKHMQCMEVWGGNQCVDSGVVMPGLDAWVYSQPCQNEAAGGDVHYVSTCAGGLVVRMVVADITGHGAGVAETGTQLRQLMRRFINRHDQLSLVRELNREFTAATEEGIFATAVVMTFEAPGNQLRVTNAGHPPPLWYQAKRKRWTLLRPETAVEAGGLPWGIEEQSPYQQFQTSLGVGDVIVCYTDSLVEAKTAGGEYLDTAGLLKIAEGVGAAGASQLIPRLLSEVEKHDPAYASRDDVTCLAFRPNGLRPYVPMRDYLLAPVRWAAAGVGLKFGYTGWNREPWDAPIQEAVGGASQPP